MWLLSSVTDITSGSVRTLYFLYFLYLMSDSYLYIVYIFKKISFIIPLLKENYLFFSKIAKCFLFSD